MSTIFEIKQKLIAQADRIAEMLLPQGYKRGNHWIVGNTRGEPGQSLSICLNGTKAGLWYDFAEGIGGDILDLWCEVKGINLSQALEEARAALNLTRPKPFMVAQRSYRRPPVPKGHPPKNRVKTYLHKERHIPLEVIKRYRIGEEGEKIIFPFYKPDGTLALVKERLAQAGAKTKPTTAQCEPILFGWQALYPTNHPHTSNPAASTHTAPHTPNPAASAHTTPQIPQHADPALFPMLSSTNRTIVITEGEIDALSLAAYGYPAVSVPFGGGKGGKHNWIENEFDHLEAFETIFLATDMDQPGEEAAHEIASRLGRHRCYRVRLPRKDANECLTAGIDADTIKAAFTCAKSFAPEGLRRALDYKDQVIGLFWPEPEKHLGYTVPYPKLEGKLHFRPAELTLWSGASGAGKSQLLSDCIPHWIAQNSRLCLASLEMKGEQSLRRLTKQTGGLEKPTKETIERILHFLDDGLILYEHVGKSSVDTLLDVFDYCRARYGCDQFIIDSLMRLGIVCDDYAGQEQAVYKMVDWAILNNVHIHLVAHARKGGLDKDIPGTEDIKGASEIGANAFNIITIWRNRSLEDKIFAASLAQEKADLTKRPGVIMNIAKQRSGDFEGKVGLWFDPQTYRYRCSFEQSSPRRYL
ncbi:toprim domain-containing protein [Bartonella krasnovii]|uniref:bifunctional DNA primase/helicase n=1 Tax=Bartonella krasnovii TaxID=2267275 RepID=UPI001F4D1A75|nr:bifunctional DNA primase/helicase [Bartonella krasnovii]UNF41909.1 toprim domain-containing protein [Bartonella krasnovii]UNF55115.1 toprim domain-containing protein [Bartonella krasnovii]